MEELEKKKKDAAAEAVADSTVRSCFDLDDRSVIPQFDQEYIQILITEVLDEANTIQTNFQYNFIVVY